MFIMIGKPHSIAELSGISEQSTGSLRKATHIAVIDDEIFPKRNALGQHDYQIKEIGDITDISAVSAYPIVLCDIKGVGKSFGSKYEGGHIIEEINKYYPNKVIVAYTGERFDPTYNRFFQIADQSIRKDADDDDWQKTLDYCLAIANNPCEQWKKTRKRLLDIGIPSIQLVRIEDLFVRSVLQKSDLITTSSALKTVSGDLKTVILNLVSSFLFALIKGSL